MQPPVDFVSEASMSIRYLLNTVCILFTVIGFSNLGRTASQAASSGVHQDITLASSFSAIHQEPIWTTSGYTLLVHRDSRTSAVPTGWVRVYTPSGSEQATITPANDIPNLTRLAVWSGDINAQGLIALAVVAVPATGSRYSAILLYDSSGKLVQTIREDGRAYFNLVFDHQGDICAFSIDLNAAGKGSDYDTVVRYSTTGSKLGSFLRRSELPAQVEIGDEDDWIGGRFSFGRTPRGVYLFIPQTQQYIESDYSGRILASASPIKPDMGAGNDAGSSSGWVKTDVDRVVVDDLGNVYTGFQQQYSINGSAGFHFGVFRLNQTNMKWDELGGITSAPVPGRLIGIENGNLVFLCSSNGAVWTLKMSSPGSL